MDWNELRDERLAVITDLCSRAPSGSLGRTALMKLCYFLQILKDVPLGYRFTLYSYGPFDSEVLSDLGTAESLGAVASNIVYYRGGYGYKIQKGERADGLSGNDASFLNKYRNSLDWVLNEFGRHSSADLELESTIIFVDREAWAKSEAITIPELAKRVRDLKPHFQEDHILATITEVFQKGLLKSARPAACGA
jgi:hypothetical protein